jgi:serine protease
VPVSLTHRRWLVPAAAVSIAAAAALGLGSAPANADQVRHHEWWLNAVHVPAAWKTTHGGGVTVAVLDSGVDPGQPDLAGSVQAGPDDTGTGEAPGSPHWGGHGTGMAALIAGHGHGPGGADGTIGIAPSARILSIRVVPDRGDPALANPATAARLPASIATGIRYAAAHGAKVIDLPLDPGETDAAGGPGAGPAAGGSAAERSAVSYAVAKGAVLVAPAGDSRDHGGPVNYPAAYPGVVAVGAFDRQFDLAHFSNGRPYVTITGPGVDVATPRPGGYGTVSSTAPASAVVAGVAALVRAEYPGLQGPQVIQALTRGTMFSHAKRPGSGFGAVDAAGTLRAAAALAASSPSTPAASPSAGPGSPAPATGFLASKRRDLIAVVAVAVLAAVLFGLAVLRRRRARRSPVSGPAPDSPLSGGLSAPPPGPADASPVPGLPSHDRRPKLAPVTGLRRPDEDSPRPGGRPPWEDAPMPENPAPARLVDEGPAAAPGGNGSWPPLDAASWGNSSHQAAEDGAPGNGTTQGWPDSDDRAARGLPPRWTQGSSGRNGHAPSSADLPGASDRRSTGHSDPGAMDDQALYEEDQQPFEDEDDRYL